MFFKSILVAMMICFTLALPLRSNETVDLFLILKQLYANEQILSKLSASGEENATASQQQQALQRYAQTKSELLSHVLGALRDNRISGQLDADIEEQKQQLTYKIAANAHLGYTLHVAADEAALALLELQSRIHRFITALHGAIERGSSDEALRLMLHDEQKSLQASMAQNWPNPDQSSTDGAVLSLQERLGELEALRFGYGELLAFFEAKTALLLSQNSLLETLHIQSAIDYFDALIPYRAGSLGFGKSLIIAAVLLFFFSIRKLIAKLAVKGMERYLLKKSNAAVHAYFVRAIQRPISLFLILFSLRLSLEIFYYPHEVTGILVQWLQIGYVILFAWGVIKLASVYGEYTISHLIKSHDNLRKEVVNMLIKLGYFMIVLFALFAIFRILEFNVSAIVASLGIGGLAVALAAKDTLSNFFASVMILLDNSFSQGDWIVCGDIEGTVVEIGLRRTTIRTFDNAMLFVPNAKLAENSIRNWSRRKMGRRIKLHVKLTYDSPSEKLRSCVDAIRIMLLEHQGIANPHTPMPENEHSPLRYRDEFVSYDDLEGYKNTFLVYLDEMSSSSIDIMIYCFTTSTDWEEWLSVKEDVLYHIIEIVHAHDLSFAFPSQSIYVEKLP
ncbi:MAG: mechanosensitive ion channel family protein [Campylobacterales bacterium]|nr:mechanosensitive ion channel family protein [Campylobacterales bacterium]